MYQQLQAYPTPQLWVGSNSGIMTPTLTQVTGKFFVTGYPAGTNVWLYYSADGGATWNIIDGPNIVPPGEFDGDDNPGEFFADPDNSLSGPGPNSTNIVVSSGSQRVGKI